MAADIGIQAAKTGMLASSEIIATIADTWRDEGLAGTVPLVVDPVCASMHGDPLLHPSALNSIRAQLFPLATLVTPNLDEVRLLVDIDVVDAQSQRDAARALHALGPQWALVKGGHLRSSAISPDLLYDGTDFYEFDAQRIDTGARPRRRRHAGGGHDVRTGPWLFGARRCRVREIVGDRVHPRGLPAGPRPRPGVRAVPAVAMTLSMNSTRSPGIAHEPAGAPAGVVLLTHGAGGSRESPLLIRICDEWARRGWLAVRYNLPYRRRRPKGPPSGSAASDQAGIVEAIELARSWADGPVIAGGHSYGGRMTSMAVAVRGVRRGRADAVLLSPASAGQARTRPHRAPARASACRRCSPTAPPTRSAASTS